MGKREYLSLRYFHQAAFANTWYIKKKRGNYQNVVMCTPQKNNGFNSPFQYNLHVYLSCCLWKIFLVKVIPGKTCVIAEVLSKMVMCQQCTVAFQKCLWRKGIKMMEFLLIMETKTLKKANSEKNANNKKDTNSN